MAKEAALFDTVVSTEPAYWGVSKEILTDFHPWMGSVFFPADQGLLALAKQAVLNHSLQNVSFGRMITVEIIIEDDHRDEINQTLAPHSVDMEKASIAHV